MQGAGTLNIKASKDEQQFLARLKSEIDRGIHYMNSGQPDRSILIFKEVGTEIDRSSSIYDLIQHNLLTSYKQRIEQLLKEDSVTPINRYLPDVFELELAGTLKDDPKFRGGFADVFRQIGMLFHEARQHEASLACLRKAIEIKPCPSYYVDLTNALAFTKKPARLEDYTRDYARDQLGRHIFITCSPKSGSTFLKNVLVGITKFRDVFSVYAGLQNEHELDMPQIAKFGNINTVTQQHARASEANLQLMQAFGIRPVVLVRNIFDTTISLLDFYRQGFTFSTFFDRDEFRAFDEQQQIELLIEYAIPWYFQFVSSWLRAEKQGRLNVMWLTYEDMIADKPGTIDRVLNFHGLACPRPEVVRQIDSNEANSDRNRFNKGVAGRGKTGLTELQKDRIRSLARHFPSSDFSVIGL